MKRQKKDIIFILVMSIIIANLSYELILQFIGLSHNFMNWTYYGITIATIIGIIGSFWLVRTYRKIFRATNEQKEQNEEVKKDIH